MAFTLGNLFKKNLGTCSKMPTNETASSGRARAFVVASMLLFVGAAISTTFISYGLYLALALVLLGGFMMLISSRIRDEARAVRRQQQEPNNSEREKEVFAA